MMAAKQYNTVRVFIDPGSQGRSDGIGGNYSTTQGKTDQWPASLHRACLQPRRLHRNWVDFSSFFFLSFFLHVSSGLSAVYMDNVVTFLEMVATYPNMGVYMTLDDLPYNQYFEQLAGAVTADVQGVNAFLLLPGFMNAKATYVRLFLEAIGTRSTTALAAVFCVSLDNEVFLMGTQPPFSLTSVKVTTATGVYDMADAASRQQCADANLMAWADTVRKALPVNSPLLTVGMFTFQAVQKQGPNGLILTSPDQDPRFPARPAVLSMSGSPFDFLDVHVYQVPGTWTMASDLASSEWSRVNFTNMDVIMGEFGAFKSVFSTPAAAASAMAQQQQASCGFNFVGNMFWTIDTWEQPELWNLVEAPNINRALAVSEAYIH